MGKNEDLASIFVKFSFKKWQSPSEKLVKQLGLSPYLYAITQKLGIGSRTEKVKLFVTMLSLWIQNALKIMAKSFLKLS